jgi:hypothetical protein
MDQSSTPNPSPSPAGKFASRKFAGFLMGLLLVGGLSTVIDPVKLGIVSGFVTTLYGAYVAGNVSEAKAAMGAAISKVVSVVKGGEDAGQK